MTVTDKLEFTDTIGKSYARLLCDAQRIYFENCKPLGSSYSCEHRLHVKSNIAGYVDDGHLILVPRQTDRHQKFNAVEALAPPGNLIKFNWAGKLGLG